MYIDEKMLLNSSTDLNKTSSQNVAKKRDIGWWLDKALWYDLDGSSFIFQQDCAYQSFDRDVNHRELNVGGQSNKLKKS